MNNGPQTPKKPAERTDLSADPAEFSLADLMQAIKDSESGKRPVESWNPALCGEIDIVIKSDGSWWHEGSRIGRAGLIGLFASVLRKDEDGQTYLVTPAEKLLITVERAHFTAVRVDISGSGKDMRLFFTTDHGGTVEAGPDHPLRVETDPITLEPSPFVNVRGRLEAALSRAVFYELAQQAVEISTPKGPQLGVYSGGMFFPLGPPAAHLGNEA
jgi:hypothetical protein